MIVNMITQTTRQSILASIGAVLLTGEGINRTFQRMERRGAQVERDLRAGVRTLLRTGQRELVTGAHATVDQVEGARHALAATGERVIDLLNIPSHQNLAHLHQQVTQLSGQVDALALELKQQQALAAAPIETIPNYDSLSAEMVIEQLPGFNSATLLALRAYEQQRANRITVLRALERLLVQRQEQRGEAPIRTTTSVDPLPRYTELRAEEIIERLDTLNELELRHVQTYEQEHQARVTVLRALEERIERRANGTHV